MRKTFKIVDGDISDGYHTFDELYEHRCLLYINLVLAIGGGALKRDHFPGWDCIYFETAHGQVSYHVPVKMRVLYEGKMHEDADYQYDGHTSSDTLERLRRCAGSLI
jgi:hypothetical protein